MSQIERQQPTKEKTPTPGAEPKDLPEKKPSAESTENEVEKKEEQTSKPAKREVFAPPVIRARARYVRIAPRKARLVGQHIRGKTVEEAQALLSFTPRAAAVDWNRLLKSAVANAENNYELVSDDLKIVTACVDEGPTIKRFRPRAMGRATPIHKRTSHLTLELKAKE